MKKLIDSESSISISELINVKISKLKQDIKTGLFRQSIIEAFNYLVVDWIWNYRLMLQEKLIKHPVTITVSGVDGGGKTTGAKVLYQLFKDQGKRVKIIHTGDTPLIKQESPEKWIRLPAIGYGIFIKDLVQVIFAQISNINCDAIIFDRYIYDTMVKISYKQQKNTLSKLFLILAFKILPKPSLSFLFETSPKVSYERDKDHSIDYHEAKHKLYHDLINHAPHIINVETTKDKKSIALILKTKIKPLLI